jgi:hypothetical protein
VSGGIGSEHRDTGWHMLEAVAALARGGGGLRWWADLEEAVPTRAQAGRLMRSE